MLALRLFLRLRKVSRVFHAALTTYLRLTGALRAPMYSYLSLVRPTTSAATWSSTSLIWASMVKFKSQVVHSLPKSELSFINRLFFRSFLRSAVLSFVGSSSRREENDVNIGIVEDACGLSCLGECASDLTTTDHFQ